MVNLMGTWEMIEICRQSVTCNRIISMSTGSCFRVLNHDQSDHHAYSMAFIVVMKMCVIQWPRSCITTLMANRCQPASPKLVDMILCQAAWVIRHDSRIAIDTSLNSIPIHSLGFYDCYCTQISLRSICTLSIIIHSLPIQLHYMSHV